MLLALSYIPIGVPTTTISLDPPQTGFRSDNYRQDGRAYYPRGYEPQPPPQEEQAPVDDGFYGLSPDSPGLGQHNRRHRDETTTTVQGNSLTTWAGLDQDRTHVNLGSEGRPVSASVEVWSGPDNTPSSMRAYSEDGAMRPINAAFATPTYNEALAVRNIGPLEFPMDASVGGSNANSNSGYGRRGQGRNGGGMGYNDPYGQGGPQQQQQPRYERYQRPQPGQQQQQRPQYQPQGQQHYPRTTTTSPPAPKSITIQGGAMGYFSVSPDCQRIRVAISSEMMPVRATVELLQGPGTKKQVAEIYTDDGVNRPWAAILETPGHGCTLCVSNTLTVECPLEIVVEAMDGRGVVRCEDID